MNFNIDDINLDTLIEDLHDFSIVNDNFMCAQASQVIAIMKNIIYNFNFEKKLDDNLE